MPQPCRIAGLSLSLLASLLLPACEGNPTCVYAGDCDGQGPNGGIGDLGRGAVVPRDGNWIANARPTVSSVRPEGTKVHPASPIVITFNESMNPDTLEDAFELVELAFGGIAETVVEIERFALVGEGRVLLLFPAQELNPSAHFLRVAGGGGGGEFPFPGGGGVPAEDFLLPTDITGQELALQPGARFGETFTVIATPPVTPRVIATWPSAGDTTVSATTSIVVVFDREMDEDSVEDDSFVVEVDGADPANDPVAEALPVQGSADPETRVFTWRSEDPSGEVVPLPDDALVEVTLSPFGAALSSSSGQTLETFELDFNTATFGAPLSASLLSMPTDAIGIRNITADGVEDLLVQVDLADGQDGDVIDLFLFGTSTSETDPQLIALRRTMTLAGVPPIMTANFGLAAVDIAVGGDPLQPRFADGLVTFAFSARRGSVVSPLRLLDVDLDEGGAQDPLLDTTVPVIEQLENSNASTTTMFSDLRDLVLAGTSDSVLSRLEVSATDGGGTLTNGTLPEVLGTGSRDAFLAAPVEFGLLVGGTASYTAVGFDAALNASPPITGTYFQRGVVGPGAFTPGDTLDIEVFDAETLRPLGNALVCVHGDMGDGINYPLTSSGTTGAMGTVSLATDGAAVRSIVTVDLVDYDLFSFHGVTSGSLSLPLSRSNPMPSNVSGTLTSSDSLVEALLPSLVRRVDDSRRPRGVVRGYATGPCSAFPVFFCDFGPEVVHARRRGVQSFVAGDFTTDLTTFNPTLVLQAFCLELPLAQIPLGSDQDTSFSLPFLLNDPDVTADEHPGELAPLVFRADLTSGIDTLNLDGDPDTTGDPRVSVEATTAGVQGSFQVGVGLAFPRGGDVWDVRSVRPGAVSPAGFFGMKGSIDTDLFVRCELRDASGNVSGARPRLSGYSFGGDVFATSVPVLVLPLEGGTTNGTAYDVAFLDSLPDASGFQGLYRVQLEDASGRRHVVWRPDPTGPGTVRVRVANVGDAGGVPLADGSITCELAGYAWGSLDLSAFLWTDVEREQDLFAISRPFQFTQTP